MGTPLPVQHSASRAGSRAALLLRLATSTELRCVELHPHGSLLVGGGANGDALLFATSSGSLFKCLAEDGRNVSPATCVAWAELDGEECVIAGHQSGNVRVWDVAGGRVVGSMAAHRADVTSLACMPPLALLATGSADTNIKLWQLPSPGQAASGGSTQQKGVQVIKEPQAVLKGHSAPITQLQFSPDGEVLISGDSSGGLRVWHVPTARLLYNLSTHHTAAITGIACHPDERLFVSCSLDRTLRVWDMDGQPGACIGVHGPEGRREVRALAFTSSGRALLAAYPDGLRTFTLDPLQHQDTADVQWSKVSSIRYHDGKLFGLSIVKQDAALHCVDLRRLKPFVKRSAQDTAQAAACTGSIAAKAQHAEGACSSAIEPTTSTHAASLPADQTASAPTTVNGPGPAARFVAQQRRRAAVLEPKAVNAGPAVQVYAAAAPHSQHPAQQAALKNAASIGGFSTAAGSGGAVTPSTTASSRPVGSGCSSPRGGGKGGRHRQSAEENTLLRGCTGPAASSSHPPADGSMAPDTSQHPSGDHHQQQQDAGAGGASSPGLSMLAISTTQGFLAAAMQGHSGVCTALRAKRSLWAEVQCAVKQRGDLRGAIRLLTDSQDLGVAAKLISSRALQRQPDRLTLELCADALPPLIASLLASATTLHQQAALQLLDAILGRWGGYIRDALSNTPRMGKVDLEMERRQQRSRALLSQLQGLRPALERLAAPLGGGSARHMLARLNDL